MEETKPSYRSKTNWWSLLVAIAALIPGGAEFIATYPQETMLVFSLVNFGLRLVTKDRVTLW